MLHSCLSCSGPAVLPSQTASTPNWHQTATYSTKPSPSHLMPQTCDTPSHHPASATTLSITMPSLGGRQPQGGTTAQSYPAGSSRVCSCSSRMARPLQLQQSTGSTSNGGCGMHQQGSCARGVGVSGVLQPAEGMLCWQFTGLAAAVLKRPRCHGGVHGVDMTCISTGAVLGGGKCPAAS